MLDERWNEDAEAIGDALRRMLAEKCDTAQVRIAEARDDGRLPALDRALADFGLDSLEGEASLFARVAFELGRALAPTPVVETLPVQGLLGRSGIALSTGGFVPAGVELVAVEREDGLYIEPVEGRARRTAAGDLLVAHRPRDVGDDRSERVGDLATADRVRRFSRLMAAARLAGASQALLHLGTDYAREREQFGRIIGQYQGVAHRLAKAAGEADAAELLVRKAAFMASPDGGGDGAPASIYAIMAFNKAASAARFVATNVHQIFGGNGFALEYDVQLYSRRLRSWAMRGARAQAELAELGRMMLDPVRRDAVRGLWHYEIGMPLPRWAEEADKAVRAPAK